MYGQEILLRTDNAAISWIRNLKKPTGQTATWLEELGTYNLTIVHRSGRKHSNVDALQVLLKTGERQWSSSNEEDYDKTSDNIVIVCTRTNDKLDSNTFSGYILDGWQPEQIRQEQLNDPDKALLLATLDDSETRPSWDRVSLGTSSLKTLWRQWDRLQIQNGMLYRNFYASDEETSHLQLVIPKSLQSTVLKNFNDIPSAGHLGANKMVGRFQQSFN